MTRPEVFNEIVKTVLDSHPANNHKLAHALERLVFTESYSDNEDRLQHAKDQVRIALQNVLSPTNRIAP